VADLLGALQVHLEDPSALDAAGELLEDRVIHLLREGSLEEIGEEVTSLLRFLEGGPGAAWAKTAPERHGAWTTLGRLLAEAAEKRDEGAIQTVLRSHKGKGRQVLEILARRGQPTPRGEILRELGIEESHLSHLLYDLEQADLIRRSREGREVMVALDWAGRDVVEGEIDPPWATYVVERIRELRHGNRDFGTAEEIERDLAARRIPSPHLARKLGQALGATDREVRTRQARQYVQDVSARFAPELGLPSDRQPIQAFASA
jgi:DNA-binding MarR family transcriptional regulator